MNEFRLRTDHVAPEHRDAWLKLQKERLDAAIDAFKELLLGMLPNERYTEENLKLLTYLQTLRKGLNAAS